MNTSQVWGNIISYAVQIGLLVGIGAALPVLFRLGSPGARLVYWQLLLAACPALPWMRPWHSEVIAISGAPLAATEVAAPINGGAPVVASLPSFGDVALWLLAAGVAVRLLWLAAGLLKLAWYRRRGRDIPMPPEWKGAAGHATLLLSDEISSPVTFGFFRPVVLLPANFPGMPGAMREAILFHELVHVMRRDWLFMLGEELVRAVFWFHPAIWWMLGEIQLAREQTVDQAVIEMTHARDPYVDTLLAMAGCFADGNAPQMDLAPAPLFLRRRHLKQRVMGIVREAEMPKTRMSKTRMRLCQAAALATMAMACWFVTGTIPLHAQAQMVADGPGVTVNLNGSQLMHRSPVAYPAEALAKGVEGTVVAQVRLDANGEVIDAAILSGPDELRRGVQQSLLNWHFDKSAGSTARVVNIDFVKPTNMLAGRAQAVPTQAQTMVVTPTPAVNSQEKPALTPDALQIQGQPTQLRLAQGQLTLARKVDSIEVIGLSDSARDQLVALLPVHAGDIMTNETMPRVSEAVRGFDEHLSVSGSGSPSGGFAIRIKTPDASPIMTNTAPSRSIPAGAQRIGGNVMAANLINAVKPVYPPLAKMARQQGTVKFEATIAKDGTMEDLYLVSGPPLLVPAAMEAVKQWVYKPTLLNGAPVEVVTTIDVNFSLADNSPPPAQ